MAFVISKIKMKLLMKSFILAAICQSCVVVLLSMNTNVYIAILLIFALGCFVALFNVPFVTLLQSHVPDHLLGRVRGGMIALSTGMSSLGYAASGMITTYLSIPYTMLAYGLVGFGLIVLLLVFQPFASLPVNEGKVVSS